MADNQQALAQATKAVADIKPAFLTELCCLAKPPDAIRDVLEAVVTLLGDDDTSWVAIRKALKSTVKTGIAAFDPTTLDPTRKQAVQTVMANKADSFDPKVIGRASLACVPLAAWVVAVMAV
eukprot:TRINITY_DN118392_c0_g1_i1.p1 TRINITY_DN118392_c0_g1~~TRINITY_DN118392_c0_g1_i1.p1  ORF type:complete len:137 (-),score=6.92 TRINITY_DN118392_c0_g1_i1:162-527(-)